MGGKRRGTLERVPHTPRTFPDSFSVARNRHMCPVPGFLLPASCDVSMVFCRCGAQGGFPARSPAATAFSFVSCPLPRRGRIFPRLALAERSSPAGAEPQRHLFTQPRGRGPSQTPKFLSPGPPLSLATGTARGEPTSVSFAPSQGATVAGRASAVNGLMPGCRGRSPRRNKLLIPPSRREGGRGDGGKNVS